MYHSVINSQARIQKRFKCVVMTKLFIVLKTSFENYVFNVYLQFWESLTFLYIFSLSLQAYTTFE